ncbi:hypothetical protein MVEN_01283200 [Mycena venus]|uniref:Uncharacterized protein n=1 Tax=Mycena venus TaxID=2733690 RepID=A0A8H7CVL5_9AGAR|nr:hypothetical protein MVEN_01283200 [Mycena venus]
MSWMCNVIQYERTGLVNGNHNLTIALLPDDPGNIGIPGLSVNGFIITTDDDPVLSVPPSLTTDVSTVPPTSTTKSSTFPHTNTTARSSISHATGDLRPKNSTTGGSVLSSTKTDVSRVPPTSIASGSDFTTVAHSSISHPPAALQTVNSVPPLTITDVSTVPQTTITRSRAVQHTNATAHSSVSDIIAAVQPTNSTNEGSVPPSTTTSAILPESSAIPHTNTTARVPEVNTGPIAGFIIAGILSLLGIAGLGNWASQVIQAKLASKPGANSSKFHEFIFLFPPYLPWPKKEKNKIASGLITLTLTPVDIEEDYTYQQVVWRRFNIDNGLPQFTARLDYDRAFGTANIGRGRDEINGVSFCDRPLSIAHAKPGRIIPLKGSAWANPLEFIIQKYNRIIARNDSDIPVRMVLGSYICKESEGSSTDSSEDVEERNMEKAVEHNELVGSQLIPDVGFQSFVVMDHKIGYAETLSASFDLILHAYKTHGVEVGQILSPSFLRDQAVPLLGEQGIRISKLPKIATWSIIPNESGIELKRERTTRTTRKRDV